MNAWLEQWTGLILIDPELLTLAGLLLVAQLWLTVRRKVAPRREPAIKFAFAEFAIEPATPSWRRHLLTLPRALQIVGLLLAIFAAARPVRREPLPRTTDGIDIMLCVDTSSSMSANDLDPKLDRLAIAKRAADQFVAGRASDRIGLIRFAAYADLAAPPTVDYQALRRLLAQVQLVERDSPEDATGIGTAVARAARVLATSTTKSKIVVLLTDGEENVATPETPDEIGPAQAAQLSRELGIRVYTVVVGVGTQSSTGGDLVDLDTTALEQLAAATGGKFFAARDAGAVTAVYTAIDQLETSTLQEPRFSYQERFFGFLVAGLALLLIGRLLAVSPWLTVLP